MAGLLVSKAHFKGIGILAHELVNCCLFLFICNLLVLLKLCCAIADFGLSSNTCEGCKLGFSLSSIGVGSRGLGFGCPFCVNCGYGGSGVECGTRC